jgi:hypothetical protein
VHDLLDAKNRAAPRRIMAFLYQGGYLVFTFLITWRVGSRLLQLLPDSVDDLVSRVHAVTPGQLLSAAILLYMQALIVRGVAMRIMKIVQGLTPEGAAVSVGPQ